MADATAMVGGMSCTAWCYRLDSDAASAMLILYMGNIRLREIGREKGGRVGCSGMDAMTLRLGNLAWEVLLLDVSKLQSWDSGRILCNGANGLDAALRMVRSDAGGAAGRKRGERGERQAGSENIHITSTTSTCTFSFSPLSSCEGDPGLLGCGLGCLGMRAAWTNARDLKNLNT